MTHLRVCMRSWARAFYAPAPFIPVAQRCGACGTPLTRRAPDRGAVAGTAFGGAALVVRASSTDAEQSLPATFVAPSTVNMDDYPPPKRRLSKDDVVVQFVRSGGAGGQNVNKVNTKADIRFAVGKADFLPDWVKRNLLQQERNRLNSDGELVVNSSRHRTQKQNYEDALEKLQAMIDTAATPPQGPSQETIQKMKTLAKKSNQKRLDEKKRDSARKAERRSRDYD